MVPGTGIEPVPLSGANFKSATSTNFVIRARSRSLAHRRALRIQNATKIRVSGPVSCTAHSRARARAQTFGIVDRMPFPRAAIVMAAGVTGWL